MSELECLTIASNQLCKVDVPQRVQKTLLLSTEDSSLSDNLVEFNVAEGAQLMVYHLQYSSATHLANTIKVNQQRHSTFTLIDVNLGAEKVENKFHVELLGIGAHCDIVGLFVAHEQQRMHMNIQVTHHAEQTTSNQNYKGLAQDHAKCVMNSRVIVNKGAQKIASTQSSKNMLLSKTATIQTQPELEIYADDVKCAHGATVGQIDESALFYLRSRGISKEDAVAMMTFAFVGENIDRIDDESVRLRVRESVLSKIPNAQRLVGAL